MQLNPVIDFRVKQILLLVIVFFTLNLQSQCKIQKIEYHTTGYASKPDFDMIIYSDATAIWNAISDNYIIQPQGDIVPYGVDINGVNVRDTEVKGIYLTKLSKKTLNEIQGMILSLDEEFKNERYEQDGLHNSISVLIIKYKNGEIKSIHDYSKNGSDKLIELYKYLEKLRFFQDWK